MIFCYYSHKINTTRNEGKKDHTLKKMMIQNLNIYQKNSKIDKNMFEKVMIQKWKLEILWFKYNFDKINSYKTTTVIEILCSQKEEMGNYSQLCNKFTQKGRKTS